MNKLAVLGFLFAFSACVARAQNTPVGDVAVGYSFLQVVSGSVVGNASGGSGSVAWNANSWLGFVGDFALYHSAAVGGGVDAGTYTFGPRFSYRRWHRVTPFAQALFGGVRYANNGTAFGAGGGVDLALDQAGRFALRPQVEYFGFGANGGVTNTVRLSLGFVFRLGTKKGI